MAIHAPKTDAAQQQHERHVGIGRTATSKLEGQRQQCRGPTHLAIIIMRHALESQSAAASKRTHARCVDAAATAR